MRKNEEISQLLRPIVESMGYELVGVEYHPNSVNALLRVYIDKPEGIDLDDCVAVNDQVVGILDVEDPIPGHYTLEISSPGLDRPLFTLEDFAQFIGEPAKIRLSRPIGRQRNFKGTIVAVSDTVVTVEEADGKQTEIDFNVIDTARLKPAL